MPKERRRRVSGGGHDPSVKLQAKRQFAVQDNAVEHVEIGEAAEQSATDVLAAMDEEPQLPVLKKKEKQQMKREALLQRVGSEANYAPYSKSHARRVKRKAREQLAGAGLDDMQLALAAVDDDATEAPTTSAAAEDQPKPAPKKPKAKPGQIGEGRSATLSKPQRQKALAMEKARHPLILANAEFAANPFQTIRTHAQNTLLQHSAPSS